MPSTIQEIYITAFGNCTSLETITLHHTGKQSAFNADIKVVDLGVFTNCDNLKTINIPTELKDVINENWFLEENPFARITYYLKDSSGTCGTSASYELYKNTAGDYSLFIMGGGAIADYETASATPWSSKKVVAATIGTEVKKVGNYCFANNTALKSIALDNSVETIGDCAFSGCSGLTEVNLSLNTKTIGKSAFASTNITEVEIPVGTEKIDAKAFYDCKELKFVIIPNSVKEIGVNAFAGCTKLETVRMPESMKDENFSDAFPENVTIEYTAESGNCGAEEEDSVTYEILAGENDTYTLKISGTGKMADYRSSTDMPWQSIENKITKIIIGNGVTHIGDYAFADTNRLSEMQIADSVLSIGINALYGSGIRSLEIPEGVEEIGNYAFGSCDSLETVKLPQSLAKIGNDVFNYCTKLENVVLPTYLNSIPSGMFAYCSKLKTIDLPDTIITIEDYAFGNSGLEEIIIPDRTIKLGEWALGDCTELKKISCLEGRDFNFEFAGIANAEIIDYRHVPVKNPTADAIKTPATCTSAAVYYYVCEFCGATLKETYSDGKPLGHEAKEVVTKAASDTADGSYKSSCKRCGLIMSTHVIPRAYITVADTVKLNKKGSNAKVSVTDVNGKAIDSKYYTYSYSNNKKVGTAKVKIVFNAPYYTGTVTKKFTVADAKNIPSKVSLKSVSLKSKKLTVNWKKGKKPATGYEIQYSTDSKFLTGVKSAKVSKLATTKTTIKSCKEKCYYVRIRSFAKTKKYTAYSAWSSSKKVGK